MMLRFLFAFVSDIEYRKTTAAAAAQKGESEILRQNAVLSLLFIAPVFCGNSFVERKLLTKLITGREI